MTILRLTNSEESDLHSVIGHKVLGLTSFPFVESSTGYAVLVEPILLQSEEAWRDKLFKCFLGYLVSKCGESRGIVFRSLPYFEVLDGGKGLSIYARAAFIPLDVKYLGFSNVPHEDQPKIMQEVMTEYRENKV